ncbi:sulfate adenylyltransferase [Klebsiella michiganensis]|nr:sulfate adenylyltransferase [Klebsiella michiganensis]
MNTTIAQQIANEGGVEAYLHAQQHKSLLRFLTCGSVDDGKSTLIGRLLHDTRQIYEDQLSSLHNDSKRHGTQGEKLDLALLVDGLQAEREQGITIDVAYRYFSTEKRKFIIAGHPGTRTVYPQHGDRRVNLRPGDPADRRPQRRARSDPPPQFYLHAAGDQTPGGGGEQNGPRRF